MGRFLAFLSVFVLGALLGAVGGAFLGGVGGAVVGACAVVDKAVGSGTLTQDEANTVVRAIASELQINAANKQGIVDPMKRPNEPPTPCVTALEAI